MRMPLQSYAGMTRCHRAGGSVVDTELLSQSSDLASRVVEAESLKLKADRVHAAEAKCVAHMRTDACPCSP